MSKEVKRYELRIVDRYAGDGTGDIETDARMKQEAKGRYVLFSDYEALLAERDAARMRVKELDLLFGRYLLAMKAALIDADHRGDEDGMRWIYNSLAGPGELPPEGETDAQAFFDREIKAVDAGMAEVMAHYRAERAALQGEQS